MVTSLGLSTVANLALGAVLLSHLLWTLSRVCPRPYGLALGFAIYFMGSLPPGLVSGCWRSFLPCFYVYHFLPETCSDSLLLANGLYCLVWVAYLGFCRWLSASPEEH